MYDPLMMRWYLHARERAGWRERMIASVPIVRDGVFDLWPGGTWAGAQKGAPAALFAR
jgi:hypothetical protein